MRCMFSEKVQNLVEKMINLVWKSEAEYQNANGYNNGPDILTLFGRKHLFNRVLQFRLSLFAGNIRLGHDMSHSAWWVLEQGKR